MLQDFKKSYRILLAEDDPDDQKIARDAIAKAIPNVCLIIVNNGREALDYLNGSQDPPHVLITDIRMPRLTGLELLALIRQDASLKRIPAVVLSTSMEPKDIQASLKLNAVLYLTKPQIFQDWVEAMKQVGALLPQ